MIYRQELFDALTAAGVPEQSIRVHGLYYTLPTRAWVQKKLSASLADAFFGAGIRYEPNTFVCRSFAKSAEVVSGWWWVKSDNKIDSEKDTELAVGLFYYSSERFGGHAINVVAHRGEAGEIVVAWYDPQLYFEEFKLTVDEIKSCIGCYFL